MSAKLPHMPADTTGLRWFPIFALIGWALIGLAVLIWLAGIGPTAASYWGGAAKAARDAAGAGSFLQSQLTFLATWPKVLLPLVFLGVASFMVGIAMEFAAIPGILERRADLMAGVVSRLARGTR